MNWVIFALIPVLIVWALVVVDIARQPRMAWGTKIAWVAAGTLIWPLLVVYWLTRPVEGRIRDAGAQGDARRRLVRLALDHEAGLVDDTTMVEQSLELRGGHLGA